MFPKILDIQTSKSKNIQIPGFSNLKVGFRVPEDPQVCGERVTFLILDISLYVADRCDLKLQLSSEFGDQVPKGI